MKKGFIKGEKVFELLLDSKARLIVYFDTEHDEYYFDSALYFFDGKKEHLLVNDSFAFHIGKGLYIRSNSINDYNGADFEKELAECQISDRYEKLGKLFEIMECVNYDAYLLRQNGKIKFLLNKLKISSTKNGVAIKRKKLYETEVSEATITQWQEVLEEEFIPKYVTELKKSEYITSEEQVQQAINSMKNNN